jgi:predicted nucleic acid-binding protein
MRIAVSNSSPLILLAKVNALDILTFFFDKIYIPPAVHREVMDEGTENAHADSILIKKLVDDHKIIVKSDFKHTLQEQPYSNHSLHPGEVDAIELAISIKGDVILLDDEEARKIARSYNLHVKGTLGLLIDYNKAGQVDMGGALKLLDGLNKIMYMSADLYRLVESNLK